MSSEHPRATARIESIDHLRVYAALTVLFGHTIHALRETRAFHGTEVGLYRQGVGPMVFLAIAGFVAVHGTRNEFGTPGAGPRYLGKRLLRIVPLYWLFTTLFVVVAWLAPSLVDHGGIEPFHAMGSYAFWPVPRPGDGRMRPLLNPGWVLVYIVWFHAWFALCMSMERKKGIAVCLALLFALAGIGALAPMEGAAAFFASRHFAVIGIGVLCLFATDALKDRISLSMPASLALTAALFVASWTCGSTEGDVPSIVCATSIVLVAARTRGFAQGSALAVAWRALARASYSIYLSQAFTLAGFAYAADRLGLLVVLPFWFAVALTMTVGLACGVLCHHLLEEPLQRALSGAWQRLRSLASSATVRTRV